MCEHRSIGPCTAGGVIILIPGTAVVHPYIITRTYAELTIFTSSVFLRILYPNYYATYSMLAFLRLLEGLFSYLTHFPLFLCAVPTKRYSTKKKLIPGIQQRSSSPMM